MAHEHTGTSPKCQMQVKLSCMQNIIPHNDGSNGSDNDSEFHAFAEELDSN